MAAVTTAATTAATIVATTGARRGAATRTRKAALERPALRVRSDAEVFL
jgi:hypothetical protein